MPGKRVRVFNKSRFSVGALDGEGMARGKVLAGASIFCVMMMVAMSFSMVVMAKNDDQKVRVIVLFKDKIDGKMVTDRGGELLGSFDNIPAVVTELKSSAINELKKNGNIKAVEEDAECWMVGEGKEQAKGAGSKPPAQPTQNIEWGIKKISADQAWTSTTDSGVSVAVLDTGIDTNHPDLAANIKGGTNLVNTRRTYEDDNGHGTHCAGIIAAVNNIIGVVGVAPNAMIYAVKVLNSAGSGSYSTIIAGIDWAISKKASDPTLMVISMSIGGTTGSSALEAACARAANAGIQIIAAAGNSGGAVLYPAAYDKYVIAVSATDSNNVIASWSCRGPQVDLAAPGVSIRSTYMGDTYATMSGTSMACPHVSGVAALVISHPKAGHDTNGNGIWDPAEVQSCLQSTATNLGNDGGWDQLYGWGLVNAKAAVGA